MHLLTFNVRFHDLFGISVSFHHHYFVFVVFYFLLLAYGVGDEMQQVNPDAPPSILSDMINNALPPPMIKDAKTNELAVSFFINNPLFEKNVYKNNDKFYLNCFLNFRSTFQKYYKMEALKVQNQQVQAV